MVLDDVSALTIEVGGKKMAILTLHPDPMEDLPPEAVPEEINRCNITVVDAHNSFSENFSHVDTDTVERIRRLLRIIAVEKEKSGGSVFRVGFSRVVPANIGLVEGMGPGGVSCLLLEIEGKRFALLAADADNAVPWVRDVALEVSRKYGVEDVEF